MASEEQSPLEFPCTFPVKVMGLAEGFDTLVIEVIRRHVNDLGEGAVSTRPSSGGKYLAVTVIVTASSRAQLDAIYRDLHATGRVLYAL